MWETDNVSNWHKRAMSELQTTKRLICSKTNAGNSLKADNPAKTKAELSKISRLQYIV
jgi:hypothetical protein